MTRRGRPRTKLGAISEAVLTLAAARPITSIDVARELQLSRPMARDVVSRLHSIGHLRQSAMLRLPGIKRPVRQVVAIQNRIPNADAVVTLSSWLQEVRTLARTQS